MTAQVTAPAGPDAAVIRTGGARTGTGVGGPGAEDDRLDRQGGGTLAAQLVVAGLTAAAFAQGGYHRPGQLVIGVTLVAAVVLCVGSRPDLGQLGDPRLRAALAALTALAVWAVVRGAMAGQPGAGLRWAASVLAVAVVLAVVSSLGPAGRATVVDGLLGVSAVVALAGWAGVVWHVERLATHQDSVWRGASTLTYANATCALLTTTALVAVARRAELGPDRRGALLLAVQLVGIGATLSRAGLVATTAGIVVLAAVQGVRRVTTALTVPLVGALIAVAGLAGSFALDAPSGRPAAVLALGAGLAVTALAHRRGPGTVSLGLLAAVAAGTLVASSGALAARVHSGGGTRLATHQAALAELADAPLAGVGPGHGPLVLPGDLVPTMQYVHDEYVETALALGLLGLVLVTAGLVLLGRATRRALRAADPADRALPAAALAALVAGCVHAAFDFVWHVPVVPLATAVVVAAAVARPTRSRTATTGVTTRRETP